MLACSLYFVFSEMILSGFTRFGYGESFFLLKGAPQKQLRGVFGVWNWGYLLEHGKAIF